ncbi:MAG: tRNA (adenosine(37)-N6)-threonylcarbamoyltransferase complex dimerization subunit type 1 TsaB [candidate division NC10 bacterium]|nr:tRNA (adenosine(37)-N6)-threonylcarbamoyltransferase complex dimerization subunit type 1 TsaB [candidate division NC10 bacterium]
MLVLGIETSTRQGGAALLSEKGLLGETFLDIAATHSERLFPAIDHLLASTGRSLEEIDGLAVAIGPGSFTGLRIGLSTAKGLALATGKPLVGVPTLEAMAWNLPFCRHPICPILDARKKEVYCALFRFEAENLRRLMEDAALTPQALVERIEEQTVFLGDGVKVYGDLLIERLKEKALFPPLARRVCSAALVAELGLKRLLKGEQDDPIGLIPRYIRPSEAELRRSAGR